MGQQAVCDACKLAFPYAPASATGSQLSCPVCKKVVQPPLSEAQRAELTSEGRRFAQDNKIRLGEASTEEVVSEDQAASFLDDLNAHLPAVQPSNQPSGIFPSAGVPTMTIGAIAGAVAGVVALLLVAAISSLIVGPVLWFNIVLAEAGWIWFLARSILLFVGLVSFGFTFGVAGAVSSMVVSTAGRIAKNRSMNAAAAFAMVSGGLSILSVSATLWVNAESIQDMTGLTAGEFQAGLFTILFVGGFVSVIAAGYHAGEAVRESHFCEDCQQFMSVKKIKALSHGALKAIIKALAQQKLAAAVSVCYEPAGKDGEVRLSCCPQCAKGYLEASMKVKVQWLKENQVKSKEESRLVASVTLSPAEVERFKAIPSETEVLYVFTPFHT